MQASEWKCSALCYITRAMSAQVAEIAEAAFECWWQEQHPGWMIFTLGNNHFESLDQIIKVSSQASGRTSPGRPAAVGGPPCWYACCVSLCLPGAVLCRESQV